MRIREIKIASWRNFRNITIKLPDAASLVCLVGANGAGKSNILELISGCAHRLGISPGIAAPRGDPLGEEHSVELELMLAEGIVPALDQPFWDPRAFASWNRCLRLTSASEGQGTSISIEALGPDDINARRILAQEAIHRLQQAQEVHYLAMDANRAYPKLEISIHEIAAVYEIDWNAANWMRERAFLPTRTLYDDWIKFLLAQENREGVKLIQSIRRAREHGQDEPSFVDHFDTYKSSLRSVLPHLTFTGVDPNKRTLLFDTTGNELSFDQLSGGEREIAFLIGQIDRFQLRRGIFLLDEPELHLNADLVRTWVSYLSNTVTTGQIWLATHSLEAVEAAGQENSFVLERNDDTKLVESVASLAERPVLSTLSRAVGSPAFAINKLRFVFVEGEESIGERERFRKLCGDAKENRFIECDSCNEVIRRVTAVRSLAENAQQHIRVGGIVDRDWRSTSESEEIKAKSDVFVLGVHEIENLFLHPPTLRRILEQNGKDPEDAEVLVRNAADARAGFWIYQQAWAMTRLRDLGQPSTSARALISSLRWDEVSRRREALCEELAAAEEEIREDQRSKALGVFQASVTIYERVRTSDDLWKRCEGKEVFGKVAGELGFKSADVAENAIFALWDKDGALRPDGARQLRSYVEDR